MEWAIASAAFLASAVEFVEAYTIVLVVGVTLSYKAVLLEGLEVAFIVITFGTNATTSTCTINCGIGGIASAAIGATIAGILVILLGALVRAPLKQIPENTLKFIVGIMLTTFGTFWAGEGFGVDWPLSDAFLLILAAIYLASSFLLVMWLKQTKQRQLATAKANNTSVPTYGEEEEVRP